MILNRNPNLNLNRKSECADEIRIKTTLDQNSGLAAVPLDLIPSQLKRSSRQRFRVKVLPTA